MAFNFLEFVYLEGVFNYEKTLEKEKSNCDKFPTPRKTYLAIWFLLNSHIVAWWQVVFSSACQAPSSLS